MMTYSKPEVTKLGGALSTIHGSVKGGVFVEMVSGYQYDTIGAYEVDE
jgi:hypothetical protein